MSDEKLPTQQPPKKKIEHGPTIRNFRIVGSRQSRQFVAVSDHFVDVNTMIDLGEGSQFEVVDAKL